MTSPREAALRLSQIDMHYGFVRALSHVDFHVMPGEVVGLLGDNGAGKSTLLKVMSGAHRPSSGSIAVFGEEQRFSSPGDAAAAGVQMVYQDLSLVDAQDVTINLNLGREILRRGPLRWLGFLDLKAMAQRSRDELEGLGVRTVAVTRPTELLSGGQRQVVAIARSAIRVAGEAKGVLLLDEPTAALGYEQTRLVGDLIRQMAANGIAIVLVTHNLPFCDEVADRIVVLNRGRKVADIATADTEPDHIVGWITGARAPQFERQEP